MSWNYLQEQVGESSAECYAVTLASALLKSNNTQEKYCCNDKQTESCQSSRFGTTLQPSESTTPKQEDTLNYCNQSENSFASVADFLVKIYQQQVQVQGLMPILEADYGLKWRESLTKYDPQECEWKTHQCLLLGGLESFLETWPKWGIMRNGECWALMMSTHLTDEKEFGLWPTVTASDYKKRGPNSKQQGLPNAVRNWPTPQVDDSKNSGHNQERRQTLDAKVWGTPRKNDSQHSKRGQKSFDHRLKRGYCAEGVIEENFKQTGKVGVLNPDWVEWLMGWPIGWSSLEPLAELSFRDWSVDPADIGEIPRITTIKTNRVNRLKAIGNGQVPQVVFAMEQIINRR